MQQRNLPQGALACCAVAMTSYDQPWPGVEYISDSPDSSDKEYFSEELFSPDERVEAKVWTVLPSVEFCSVARGLGMLIKMEKCSQRFLKS